MKIRTPSREILRLQIAIDIIQSKINNCIAVMFRIKNTIFLLYIQYAVPTILSDKYIMYVFYFKALHVKSLKCVD